MTLPYEYLTHPDFTPFNAFLNRLISEERWWWKDDGLTLRFPKGKTGVLPLSPPSGSTISRRLLMETCLLFLELTHEHQQRSSVQL
jgi:hypothetical protein